MGGAGMVDRRSVQARSEEEFWAKKAFGAGGGGAAHGAGIGVFDTAIALLGQQDCQHTFFSAPFVHTL
jgi:hypothetical protein